MGRSINPVVWDQWRKRLRGYESSGLTVAAWCRGEGVSQAGFYQWRKKLAGRSSSKKERSSESPGFVSVIPRSMSSAVVLTLANGVRVEVPSHERSLVTDVVQIAAAGPSGGADS